jgi:hypothetical protein
MQPQHEENGEQHAHEDRRAQALKTSHLSPSDSSRFAACPPFPDRPRVAAAPILPHRKDHGRIGGHAPTPHPTARLRS